jgi:hypothetical protein
MRKMQGGLRVDAKINLPVVTAIRSAKGDRPERQDLQRIADARIGAETAQVLPWTNYVV